MEEQVHVVEVPVAAADDELLANMRAMKKIRECGYSTHVVCRVKCAEPYAGANENVPEVRALCRRLMKLGFTGYLDFTTRSPSAPKATEGVWGHAEVWLCGDEVLGRAPWPCAQLALKLFLDWGEASEQADRVIEAASGMPMR